MCGIAGIYYFENKPVEALETAEAMAQSIAHRGPDESGIFENERLVLAHQRLSIIDLHRGHQPMFNEDGSIVVTYNGEIYNYKELRLELEARGHIFSTSSDTEVLVHLYESFGLDLFDKLNGIFAFALWDGREEKLVLARDHFGVKPLHIHIDRHRLVFASEIKAILANSTVVPKINKQAVHYFMNLRYVPGKETLFAGVERLLAGEFLVTNRRGVHRRFYWKQSPLHQTSLPESKLARGLRDHLAAAVSRQLLSDVPLGIYLSGGMDSSSILAMARHAQPRESLITYTLGFNEPTDEIEDAETVANYFHTRHYATVVEPEPLQLLPQVIWHVEEPKINILQGFLLAQHARHYTKVALAGLGGDELFAGYVAYQYMKPSDPFHRLVSSSVSSGLLKPICERFLSFNRWRRFPMLDEYRRGGHLLLSLGDKCQYYGIIRNVWDYDAGSWSRLYGPRMREGHLAPTRRVFEPYFADNTRSFLEQALTAEFQTKMVDDFLLNEDRVSMAHGLEVRVPFLDRDLVSFANRLPAHFKMRGLQTKYIFKKSMQGILPNAVLLKKKWGFTFNPYLQFKKDLRQTARRVLTRRRVRELGLFNYNFIKEVLHHPPHPRLHWHYFILWIMLGFHVWHDMFLSSRRSSSFDVRVHFDN